MVEFPSERIFSKNPDLKYSASIFFLFIATFFFVGFLAVNKADAGYVYATVILVAIVSVISIKFFVKGDYDKVLSSIIRTPFASRFGISAFFSILGILAPILLLLLPQLSITQPFAVTPLFSNEINNALQSFSAVELQQNKPVQYAIISIGAGVGETIVFSWAMMIIMGFISLWLLSVLMPNIGFTLKKILVMGMALILTALTFTGLHVLNGTYNAQNFWIAFLFMLISNFLIFVVGIYISFFIFYHISNNLVYLYVLDGAQTFWNQGILTIFGVSLGLYIALMLWQIIRNWEETSKDISDWFSNLIGG